MRSTISMKALTDHASPDLRKALQRMDVSLQNAWMRACMKTPREELSPYRFQLQDFILFPSHDQLHKQKKAWELFGRDWSERFMRMEALPLIVALDSLADGIRSKEKPGHESRIRSEYYSMVGSILKYGFSIEYAEAGTYFITRYGLVYQHLKSIRARLEDRIKYGASDLEISFLKTQLSIHNQITERAEELEKQLQAWLSDYKPFSDLSHSYTVTLKDGTSILTEGRPSPGTLFWHQGKLVPFKNSARQKNGSAIRT